VRAVCEGAACVAGRGARGGARHARPPGRAGAGSGPSSPAC
jgi:hypothetical protein